MAKPYLILYNLASCLGWAYVLYVSAVSAQQGARPEDFWKNVALPLKLVQTAAVLEVFHSLFGLVPSPVMSTAMQVASRVILLWGYTNVSVASQQSWSLYLMVCSWALVEVPRYLFYAVNLVTPNVPGPLFFMRYNLFSVLYPSGITGEILQIWNTLPMLATDCVYCFYASLALILVYVPGSPFMYMHMISQKKRATEKRKASQQPKGAAPSINGIEYPLDENNERGTTTINKGAFEASIRAVDTEAADAIKKEKNWRFGYAKHAVRNVEMSLETTEKCNKIAAAGLEYLHNTFEFHRQGKVMSLATAMKEITGSFPHTGFIKGSSPKPDSFEYTVPYKRYGSRSEFANLKGEALVKQLDEWAKYGTIEPDVRDAITAVAKNGKWTDLSDQWFVLLGAGSAMGPLLVLLELGANIIAIDLDRKPIWDRLIKLARKSCGTMTFPLKKSQDELATDDDLANNAGCNLFCDTPEIANWIAATQPTKRLIIGGYAYLDGAMFLKVSIAMDAIIGKVLQTRKDACLAFLCSPTDVFVTPNDAHDAMKQNLKNAPFWQKLIAMLFPKLLQPNPRKQITSKDGTVYSVVDGLVVPQGPNYALAKRLQHWRCMLSRTNGHLVSTNIAPSTATASVVHNAQFAAAYGGMHHFKPMQIMYQETSNAVMAALLIHDIRSETSVANPNTKLGNPQELFAKGSFHGGIWRMGYKMNSIGPISAAAFYFNKFKVVIAAVLAATAGAITFAVKNPPHNFFKKQ